MTGRDAGERETTSAEVLCEAAAAIREEWTDFDRVSWPTAIEAAYNFAVADLLDNAAEDEELLAADGRLGPAHDSMMRRIGREKALVVARAYLGDGVSR